MTWMDTIIESLKGLLQGFIDFVPNLLVAIIVFVIGWFIAIWVGKLIAEILKRVKFDTIFEKTQWDEALEKAGFQMKMSGFVGGLLKWILVIVSLGLALRFLGLGELRFVDEVIGWLPNLVVAVAIFIVAMIVADISEKLVKAVVGKMGVSYAGAIGVLVRWAIWIFAALAILEQLNIQVAGNLIEIIVGGVVLSLALAFGLGGKDVAREVLQGFRAKLK